MKEMLLFPVPEWMRDEEKEKALAYYPFGFLEQLSEHYRRCVTLGAPQQQKEHSSLVTYDVSFPVRVQSLAKKSQSATTLGIYRVMSLHVNRWDDSIDGRSVPRPECDITLFSYEGTHPLIKDDAQLAATLWNNRRWKLDEKTRIVFPGIKNQHIALLEEYEETEEIATAVGGA